MNKNTTNTTPAIHSISYFGAEQTLQVTLTSLVALVGVLGNILTCITLMSKHQPFRPPIKQYLMSLAVADIGILTIAYPIVISRSEMPSGWPFGEYVCRIVFPLTDVFFGASIWAVTAVSIERWRKISMTSFKTLSSKYAVLVVAVIWAVSFLVTSTPFYIAVEFIDTGNKTSCFYDWGKHDMFREVYSIVLFLYWFGIPMCIISWNYIIIKGKLNESTKFIIYFYKATNNESAGLLKTMDQTLSRLNRKQSNGQVHRRLKENKKAKRILTPVVVVFAITMFPLNLLYLTLGYWPHLFQTPFFPSIAYLCILLVVVNSSCNPIIYGVVSRKFRNSLRTVLKSAYRKTLHGGCESEREPVQREDVV